MIYPENFESKIKFDRIREMLTGRCRSDMGRELVKAMTFSEEDIFIRENLEETAEFMRIVQEEEFPGDYYADARPFLNKIRIEGLYLDIPELVALKNSLESLTAIVRFFNGKNEQYPHLTQKAGQIQLFPYVLQRLDSIVSKHGTIKDNASSELNDIRRNILKKQSGISRRMQSLLQQAQSEGWAEKDSSIAIRDGRMVIPVPSAYKRRINGIVHDESTTGKTSYIEPAEIIETNNEIRELQLEEKREIIRILRKFSDDIRPYIDHLIPAYNFWPMSILSRPKHCFPLKSKPLFRYFKIFPKCGGMKPGIPCCTWLLKIRKKTDSLKTGSQRRTTNHTDFRTECRREIRVSANSRTSAIHVSVRFTGTGKRGESFRYL